MTIVLLSRLPVTAQASGRVIAGRPDAMPSEKSVTWWIGALKEGNQEAARELWQRYFDKLVRLGHARLGTAPRRVADEEDVALSVFRCLCDGAARGQFSQLTDRDDLWHCTTCFSCQERCPKGVLITQAVLWLRAEAVRRGLYPPSHITALREIASTGNTFPLDDQVRATRGRLSLPLDPPDCAHDPEELAAFHRLIEVLGFEKMAPPRREYGSGGTGVDGGDGEDLGGNGDDDVEGNGDDDVEGNGDDDVGVRGDDDAVENGNDEGNDGTGGGDGR